MTLNSYEKVFQSDLMRVPPLADAMGFGLTGNWVLNGLTYTYSTLSFTLSAGKAILGGRVFFLNQSRTFTLSSTAGTYYLCLSQDISKTNTEDSSGTVTNNQFTLQIKATGDMIWGDVVGGDLQSDFALYKIVTDGSKITNVTQITFNYYKTFTFLPSGDAISSSATDKITLYRAGNFVTISLQGGTYLNALTQATQYVMQSAGTIPTDCLPMKNQFLPCFVGDFIPFRVLLDTNGQMAIKGNVNTSANASLVIGAGYTCLLAQTNLSSI